MAKLTPKQQGFCTAYIETGNASAAYRRAYNAEKMSDDAIKVEASRLLDHPNIALTLASIQAEHAEEHCVNVDRLTGMLLADRELARTEKRPEAAIHAVMAIAKIHGLIVNKSELTGKDGGPIETVDRVEMAPKDRARRIAHILHNAISTTEPEVDARRGVPLGPRVHPPR